MFCQKTPKNGFTLVELLVGMAIVMALAIGFSQINFAPRISRENINRFSAVIVSSFNTQRMGNLSGKQVKFVSVPVTPTFSALRIHSGTIETRFYSGASISFVNSAISAPFFGDPFYKISTIEMVEKDATSFSGSAIVLDVLFDPVTKNLSFSGTNGAATFGNEYVQARIHLDYKDYKQAVDIDRRTGKIEVINE